MDGVTVLAQEAITSFNKPMTIGVALVVAILCMSIHVILIMQEVVLSNEANNVCLLIAMILVATSSLCCSKFTEYKTGEYTYMIKVDDTVLMSEFFEKYDIIEQNGSIFTVKLKENVSD